MPAHFRFMGPGQFDVCCLREGHPGLCKRYSAETHREYMSGWINEQRAIFARRPVTTESDSELEAEFWRSGNEESDEDDTELVASA